VALRDDFVELLCLGRGQGGQAEVINDQQVRSEQLSQRLFPASIGASRVEASEQLRALDEQGSVTDSAGLIPQRLGQMSLPYAGRPVENHMLFLVRHQPLNPGRSLYINVLDSKTLHRIEIMVCAGRGSRCRRENSTPWSSSRWLSRRGYRREAGGVYLADRRRTADTSQGADQGDSGERHGGTDRRELLRSCISWLFASS
jgi:hypothetical protein